MTTAVGVASIGATLRQLLTDGVGARVTGFTLLGTSPPDRTQTKADSQLHLFLFHVSRNPGWFNEELPTFDRHGGRVSRQRLALDLHYLLYVAGDDAAMSEALLGGALATLHEHAMLDGPEITGLLSKVNDLDDTIEQAGLGQQPEQLSIVVLHQTLDEMARLWSAFQSPMRAHAIVQVSCVLIDPIEPAASARDIEVRSIGLGQKRPDGTESPNSEVAVFGGSR